MGLEANPSFATSSVLPKHAEQIFFFKLIFRITPRIIKLGTKSL